MTDVGGQETAGVVRKTEKVKQEGLKIRILRPGQRKWDDEIPPSDNFPEQVQQGRFKNPLDALRHLAEKGKKPNESQEAADRLQAREKELRSMAEATIAAHSVLDSILRRARHGELIHNKYGDKFEGKVDEIFSSDNASVGELRLGVIKAEGEDERILAQAMEDIASRLAIREATWQQKEVVVGDGLPGMTDVDIAEEAKIGGVVRQRELSYLVSELPSKDFKQTADDQIPNEISEQYPNVQREEEVRYIIGKKQGSNEYSKINLASVIAKEAKGVKIGDYLKAQGYTDLRQVRPNPTNDYSDTPRPRG